MAEEEIDEPRSRSSRLAALAVVLATVLAVLSVTTTWIRTQALDTDAWVEVSEDLLDEPEVQERLAVFLTDQLYASVDVPAELEELLPEDLGGLAGPLAGALRDPATAAVERVLASERVAELWRDANRRAHEAMVRILRDETRESVEVADGAVVLDLGLVLVRLGETLGLPESALERIPPDAGRITVFQSDELRAAQTTVQVFDFLSWFLFVVVVALYAGAVVLAEDRRAMLGKVGIAVAAGGIAVLALRALAVQLLVRSAVSDPNNENLAEFVAGVATKLVEQMAWSGMVYGILIVAFAALLGPHRWARASRAWIARTPAPTAVTAGLAAAVVVVASLIAPGEALGRAVTALTLVALLVGAVISLSLVIRDEQPSTERAG